MNTAPELDRIEFRVVADRFSNLFFFLNDAEFDSARATVAIGPENGVVGSVDGELLFSIRYQPNPGFTGVDQITLRLEDDRGAVRFQDAVILVRPKGVEEDFPVPILDPDPFNFPPFAAEFEAIAGLLGTTTTGQLFGFDEDGDTLFFSPRASLSPQFGDLTIAPDGAFTYTPRDLSQTEDSFAFYVSDGRSVAYGSAIIQLSDSLEAGDGDDLVRGSPVDNLIDGGGGRDRLFGGGGDDTVLGERGKDVLAGGVGDDQLFGGAGADVLKGNRGKDELRGENGDDRLIGGGGADELFGGSSRDQLFGGGGADVLVGGKGRDLIKGGGGSDTLSGTVGLDTLAGGAGADQFNVGGLGGVLVIEDFTSGQDRIAFFRNAVFEELVIVDRAFGTLVQDGNLKIRLLDQEADMLTVDDFLFG